MEKFLDMLKNQNMNKKIDTNIFTQMLIDEEYLTEDGLQNCYFCDNEHFDIIRGGKDVYEYIANRIQSINSYDNADEHFKEVHQCGLLCNWLNFHGVPVFSNADEFPNLALLYCKNCGRILGIKLEKWYYPYCGFFDELQMNYF